MPRKKRLGLKDADRLLRAVVREFGADHVAETFEGGCVYYEPVWDDKKGWYRLNDEPTAEPSCVVGQIVNRWGDPDLIALVKERNDLLFNTIEMPDLLEHVTESAQLFLRRAQAVQDEGQSWGEAKRAALGRS